MTKLERVLKFLGKTGWKSKEVSLEKKPSKDKEEKRLQPTST